MTMHFDQHTAKRSRGNTSTKDVQRVRDRYLKALLKGDEADASEAIQEAVSLKWELPTIYLDVLGKAMVAIGDMWHASEITIGHEHQATQVTLRQAALLRQYFPRERKTGLHAVVAAVERDSHMLGAMMFCDFLYFDGWNTDFLGAGIPAEDLEKLVTERKPDLVALSATIEPSLETLEQSIRAVRRGNPSTYLVIGGNAVSANPEVATRMGADLVATDPVQASKDVGAHFDIRGTAEPLENVLERVGAQIRARRLGRRWSQQQLAEAAGLDRTYLSGVEHGKQNPTLAAIKKIGDALNVPISEFFS